MPDTVAQLVQRARALPPEDLEALVEGLLAALHGPAQRELDAPSAEEIGRRLAEYDSGAVEAVDAEDVFAKAAHCERAEPE